MGKKRRHLVCQHLEGISANALETYQDIIREYIRGRHGIYALYKRDRLYYVGLATNLRSRLKQHLRVDRHRGLWDRFSVYLTIENHHIKELESLFLRIMMPKGNKHKGKFPSSQDLKRQLSRDVKRRQREELEVLMGRQARVTRTRTKKVRAKTVDADTTLGRYIDGPFKIRVTYKRETYRANVRRDGWIYYKGHLYRSPSGLAKEITGRQINGWTFWKYERAPGDWVPLSKLKS